MPSRPYFPFWRRLWKTMQCIFLAFIIGNRCGLAQQVRCADTVRTVLHTAPLFQPNLPFSSLATKSGGAAIFQSVTSPGTKSLLLYKSDASGNPDWAKKITAASSVPWDNLKQLDDGTIVINSQAYRVLSQSLGSSHLLVDTGGDVIWQGDYTNQDQDSGIQVMNSGTTGTIIWAGTRLLSSGGGITIQYFDYVNEAELWRRNFGLNNSSFIQLFLCGVVDKN